MSSKIEKKADATLSELENDALRLCEERIERGLETFIEVGSALVEIRDSRLYRDTHKTFEEYCGDRWSMSRIQAHRLITATAVVQDLLPRGNKSIPEPAILPSSEGQVRHLSRLEPPQRKEAWDKAVETAGSKAPTSKQVAAAAQAIAPGPVRNLRPTSKPAATPASPPSRPASKPTPASTPETIRGEIEVPAKTEAPVATTKVDSTPVSPSQPKPEPVKVVNAAGDPVEKVPKRIQAAIDKGVIPAGNPSPDRRARRTITSMLASPGTTDYGTTWPCGTTSAPIPRRPEFTAT